MKLEQLLEGVPFTLVQGSLDTEVQDIIYDSRKAAPGLAFVCIVGTQRDSHEFAADCAAKGVSVLVIQHDIDLSAMPGVTVSNFIGLHSNTSRLFSHLSGSVPGLLLIEKHFIWSQRNHSTSLQFIIYQFNYTTLSCYQQVDFLVETVGFVGLQ